MSTVPRLSLASLATASASDVALPVADPRQLTVGLVHLGIGAFHRAHQAVYTEDAAAATGETRWGILGVTGRSDSVVRQLSPQDCLYGVLSKGASDASLRLIGSVRDVAWPHDRSEHVVRALAAPTTQVITLTITEAGYLSGPTRGPDVTRDLTVAHRELAGEVPVDASRTLPGLLVRGLARRFLTGRAPVTVVSCDNMAGNGTLARAMVTSLALEAGAPAAFMGWLESEVTFPSTMVDRITPATTEGDRERAAALLGLRDEALVVAEPFGQWVIEDTFAGDRPRWELAGAILTADVAPYEAMKLRILNATHSMLAYLGALMGYSTIAAAIADPVLRNLASRMITEDVMPTLTTPGHMDLGDYRDSVLARFANPNLAHTTAQVAMDGSQKLQQRLFPTIADRLVAGVVPQHLALLMAAWITYVAATPDLADPLAGPLRAAVPSTAALLANPGAAVGAVCALDGVIPASVGGSMPFRKAVITGLETVRELASSSARP